MGEGNKKPEILPKLAQYELTLKDWVEAHKGYQKICAFAGKCWPAFQTQFGFVPCYVNSRLTAQGIPVSCEVDIYGALSEFIGTVVSQDAVTLLDINNSVPQICTRRYQRKIQLYTERYIHGIPLWKYCIKQAFILRDEIPDDHGKNSSGRSYTGNSGRRYRAWRYHILSSAEHSRQQTSCIRCTGRSSSGSNKILRCNRCIRNSRDGKILPSRTDRKRISTSRSSCIRTFGKALFEVFKYIGVPVEEMVTTSRQG